MVAEIIMTPIMTRSVKQMPSHRGVELFGRIMSCHFIEGTASPLVRLLQSKSPRQIQTLFLCLLILDVALNSFPTVMPAYRPTYSLP